MSLDLNPETETAVRERAASEGVSVNELLARAFIPKKPQNGAVKTKLESEPEMIDWESREPQTSEEYHARAMARIAKAQAQDKIPFNILPSARNEDGLTPTQTLFKQWEAEDALLTDEEREANARLWEEIHAGINETRASLGMRLL